MTEPSTRPRPCPLWRRLIALAYDLLIVVAIMLAANMIGLLLTGGHLLDAGNRLQAWWFPLFEAACVGGYFYVSWRRGGQTAGMRPWHIRLSGTDGSRLSPAQAATRLAVAALPLLLLALQPALGLRGALEATLIAWVGWFAPALLDPRRRALHDMAAGTELRRID